MRRAQILEAARAGMTDERLTELISGLLKSEPPILRLPRLMMALRLAVAGGGQPAADAVEEYCAEQAALAKAGEGDRL